MLFLAVFCGYLAEDFRENQQEKMRAEALAKRFYFELKEDSIALENVIEIRKRREAAFHYLRKYFKDSSLTRVSKTFSLQFNYGLVLFTPTLFDPQDVILEQIRSGGTMEYFKDPEIQTLTGKLVSVMAKVRNRNNNESENHTRRIGEFLYQHSDPDWTLAIAQFNGSFSDTLTAYAASEEERQYHLRNPTSIDGEFITNTLGSVLVSLISTRKLTYRNYQTVNTALLKRFREVYHFKKNQGVSYFYS